MNLIDRFLNQITMYRLVLYYLIGLLIWATMLSFLGLLAFDILPLFLSTIFLVGVCWLTNSLFAKVFEVPTNLESVYITGLILALIITPIHTASDLGFLFWAGVLAISSKYILALHKKHLFNPVALSVVVTSLVINQSASWWGGTADMLPAVLLGGALVVRKIQRFDLVFSFLLTSLVLILSFAVSRGSDLLTTLEKTLLDSPIIFFSLVMLTEPLTTPPTKFLQTLYGGLVGLLFAPQIHLGSFYTTPEIALVVGNLFSFLVSPKQKLILKLKQKVKLGPELYDFIFEKDQSMSFLPGQYMEWTLGQPQPDSRGSRRYFTLASSPTEPELRIGVKFSPNSSSSFKKELLSLDQSHSIIVSQLAGEFTLPKDPDQKLVFIAGGIGITPFRSMIKYLIDTKQNRDIYLFYSAKTVSELIYTEIFDQAKKYGLKVVYTITDPSSVPPNWSGQTGYLTPEMITQLVPDFKNRVYFLSGPHALVNSFAKTLAQTGISHSQIKSDFFPGFA